MHSIQEKSRKGNEVKTFYFFLINQPFYQTPHPNPLLKERELVAAEFLAYGLLVVFLLLEEKVPTGG